MTRSARSAPAPHGTATVDLDGTILHADAVYAEICGTTLDDLVGRNIRDFADIEAGYAPAAMQSIVLRTGQPLLSIRDYVRPDGTRISCRVQLCLLNDGAGEPRFILAVVQRL